MDINQKDLVSIVISYYNLGKYVEETVNSIINQTYKNIEIIFVNDGSNDKESIKVLDKLKNLFSEKIKFIDQTNHGLSNARNTGIKASKGKYICCMDSDDKIDPSYIEKLHNKIKKENNLGIVSSWAQLFGDANDIWYTSEMTPATALVNNTLCVSSLFRKICWKKVGGYDESNVTNHEDWDFWISIIEKGYKSAIVPKTLFKYRIHPNSMSKELSPKRLEILERLATKHSNLLKKNSKFIYLDKEKHLIYLRNQLEEQRNYGYRLNQKIKSIKNSLSWKIVMFSRIKLLDNIVPNRQNYSFKLITWLRKIKNNLKQK